VEDRVTRRYWRGPNDRRRGPPPAGPEFPDGAATPPPLSRRDALQLLGASATLASAAACSRGPAEYIVPYVRQPPEVTPSVPTLYATAMAVDGYGIGMLVSSHEGRPTKAEGNPHHPASLGALGALQQASILDLYDPARASEVLHNGAPGTWHAFAKAIAAPPPHGKRTHVLLEPTSAPHLVDLVQQARRRGDIIVHFDSPLARANAYAGARLAFGRVVETRWAVEQANVVVALDSDFLGAASTPLSWARAWAQKRRIGAPSDTMSRLYAVEARLSVTGMAADERLRVQSRRVGGIAADLLAELIAEGADVPREVKRAAAARPRGAHADFVRAVAADLSSHRGAAAVIVGDAQPPFVHAVGHAINEVLGNVRRTVVYAPPPIFEAGEEASGLAALVRAIDAGEVETLVIVGGDPAYTAFADLDLARRIQSVPLSAFVGSYENHTAQICGWFVPEAHFLESWSDARAFDGTASIAQPLIFPLVQGFTAGQVVAALVGRADATSRDLVESYWRATERQGAGDAWPRALARGVVEDSATRPIDVRIDWAPVARALGAPPAPPATLEIVYFADAKVLDGRFGSNAWLQELPEPVTKLTWDNAALLSPATAARWKVDSQHIVDLEVRGRKVRAPVLVVPSMADDVVAVALGYGQSIPDRLSYGVGANAYLVRDSRAPWFDDATAYKVGGSWPLALTQDHWSMEGRPIVLERTLEEFRKDPEFARPLDDAPRSLYLLAPDAEHQWGMTIDLNACTGCSACVVACVAENNVPVVGKQGVRRGREMHWLRIDRYFEGDPSDARVVVQPMLCQHCEKAPCEYVCPVNATVHSHDGLNEMIYNRCVGTRFCSNNCPYKVRRFNFFKYNPNRPASYNRGASERVQLAMNPDVTVRQRGVMEKCTYCVQRIREVEIRSRREQRPIKDLEIQTACQQTCPTGAIVFGDIADPHTRVSQTRTNRRIYQVLHDLGTLPRTRYLARIRNRSPELARS
jgi:molybdopterin-containing oxidoreductase family iron-sulfur binding subunit